MVRTARFAAVALLLVAPSMGFAVALAPGEVRLGTGEEARAWVERFLREASAGPAAAPTDDAAWILADLFGGDEVSGEAVVALQRAFESSSAETRSAIATAATVRFLDAAARTQGVNQELWDYVGEKRSQLELILVAQGFQKVQGFFLPHGIAPVASRADFRTTLTGYCEQWSCDLRETVDMDLLSATRIQHGGASDVILQHLATSTTRRYGYTCANMGWSTGWTCKPFSTTSTNDLVLGGDVSYLFAFPVTSAEVATRATTMDAAMSLYDRLAQVHTQKPRELSSASSTPVVPANPGGVSNVVCKPAGVPGSLVPCVDTRSGPGDLAAVSPPPNHFGVAKTSTVPLHKPGYPPAPPVPVVDAPGTWGQVRVREEGDQSLKGDATGVNVGFEASTLRTFRPAFVAVRVHLPAASAVATPPLPADATANAKLLYSAGAHYLGEGVRLSASFGLDDPTTVA